MRRALVAALVVLWPLVESGGLAAVGAPSVAVSWRQIATTETATPEQLAVLEGILARPEFRAAEGRGVIDVLLDPFRTAIWAVIREVVRFLGRLLEAGGPAAGYAGLAAALAIVLGAGLMVFRLARGTLASEVELAGVAAVGPPRAEAELAHARALAAAGDLRAAVHHQYLAVLRRLDEQNLVPFERSLTNREHLARADVSPALAARLGPLVGEFDRLWYGQPSCSREEYERFATLAADVWSVLSGQRSAGSRR